MTSESTADRPLAPASWDTSAQAPTQTLTRATPDLPKLETKKNVTVEVAVHAARGAFSWAWYASEDDWAAGPLPSSLRPSANTLAWFATAEALRRFPKSHVQVVTENHHLAAYLAQNKKISSREFKRMRRFQRPVLRHTRSRLSADLRPPVSATEIARTLPATLIGPASAYSGGGRILLDGVETTLLFCDGSYTPPTPETPPAAGIAYTNGETVRAEPVAAESCGEAEMLAALLALEDHPEGRAILYSDSAVVIRALTPDPSEFSASAGGLRGRLALIASTRPDLQPTQILGHALIPGNMAVDRAARAAARTQLSPANSPATAL